MSNSEFFFTGSGNVLKPNHITRYRYPCLLGYPLAALKLQEPVNCAKRTRPQGSGSWDTTFLTITRAGRDPHTETQISQRVAGEKGNDHKSKNPLGRAMRRVTAYQGNSVLECGKFAKRKGEFVYVVKRTTMLPLGGADKGKFKKDEDKYSIPVEQWWSMRPPMEKGLEHDSWWVRLNDLFQQKSDRAFWSVRECQGEANIPPPLYKWLPRKDLEGLVTVHTTPTTLGEFAREECPTCNEAWFTRSLEPCSLRCGHHSCIECLCQRIDNNYAKQTISTGETDPGGKFWRCIECRAINAPPIDRDLMTAPDELPYWRWVTAHKKLALLVKNWPMSLFNSAAEGWLPELPEAVEVTRDSAKYIDWWKLRHFHATDAIAFIAQVPVAVAKLLPWGFSLDNPAASREAAVLLAALAAEIRRLAGDSRARDVYNTPKLIAHMQAVGEKAVVPVVVQDKAMRLGNPVVPPGYDVFRVFVCEWAARGCFLSKGARMEIVEFVGRMGREKGCWWRGDRELDAFMG